MTAKRPLVSINGNPAELPKDGTALSVDQLGVGVAAPTAVIEIATPVIAPPGTINISGASNNNISGTGTKFTAWHRVGDQITATTSAGSETKRITKIQSDAAMTTEVWSGTASGVAYSYGGSGVSRLRVAQNGNVRIGNASDGGGGQFNTVWLMRNDILNFSASNQSGLISDGTNVNSSTSGALVAYQSISLSPNAWGQAGAGVGRIVALNLAPSISTSNTGNVNGVYGIVSQPTVNNNNLVGSFTTNELIGSDTTLLANSGGTNITTVVGHRVSFSGLGGISTFTEVVGFKNIFGVSSSGGTVVTRTAGFMTDSLTTLGSNSVAFLGGTTTIPNGFYGIYFDDGGAGGRNYLGGALGIGVKNTALNSVLEMAPTTSGDNNVINTAQNGVATYRNVRYNGGNPLAPTAVQNADSIVQVTARGYGTSQYSTTDDARIKMVATQNWTDTAHGTEITLGTTLNGTVAIKDRVTIANDGAVKLLGASSGSFALKPAASGVDLAYNLPGTEGKFGQGLGNDAAGSLKWMGSLGGIMSLPNLTPVKARGPSLSVGDNVVYTAPAGKRAWVPFFLMFNAGSSATVYLTFKTVGGTVYRAGSNGTVSTNFSVNSTPGNGAGIVLEPGESIGVNTTVAGINAFGTVYEFDSSAPFFSPKLTSGVAGDNTLYTVATGKSASLGFQHINSAAGAGTAAVWPTLGFGNTTGATQTYSVNLVDYTGAVGSSNIMASGLAVNDAQATGISLSTNLTSGDFISVNLSSSTAGQLIWTNVWEA